MPVRGARKINQNFRRILRTVQAEIAEELQDSAEDLRERSNQLAPQLSGDMIDSGKIRKRSGRTVVRRTVFYTSPYAVIRHEDRYNLGPISSLKRSRDGPIGRKYLQRAFELHASRYERQLGEAINRGLRQGVR